MGYVYILVNASMPGLVKIGKTERTPDQRASELFTTGVPESFEVAFALSSEVYENLEDKIHYELDAYRVNHDREFFRFPVDGAVEVLKALHIGEPSSKIKMLKALHAGDPSTNKSFFETLEKGLKDSHPNTRADAVSTLLFYIDKYQGSFEAVIQLLIYVVDSESWSDKSYAKHQTIKWLRRTQDSRAKAALQRYEQRMFSSQRAEKKANTRVSWKGVRPIWLLFACVFCILSIGVFLLVQLAGC